MGIAARSGLFMEITLAPMVWKLLVEEPVTLSDYGAVDCIGYTTLQHIRQAESSIVFDELYSSSELDFTVPTLSGSLSLELHEGGASDKLTWENRGRYCEELSKLRLAELGPMAAAVRRGLRSQIPAVMLQLLPWQDLEKRVCGCPAIDLALLQSITDYDGYLRTDAVVTWLWEILEEYSPEERKAFLRFTWGRTRLPLAGSQFQRRMKIAMMTK